MFLKKLPNHDLTLLAHTNIPTATAVVTNIAGADSPAPIADTAASFSEDTLPADTNLASAVVATFSLASSAASDVNLASVFSNTQINIESILANVLIPIILPVTDTPSEPKNVPAEIRLPAS